MADATSAHEPLSERASSARRGLAVFFAALVPLSVVGYWLFVHGAPVVFVFVPAASSVIARLALGEGVADVSFRLGGRRTLGEDVPEHPLSAAARTSSDPEWRDSVVAGSDEMPEPPEDLSEP